MPERLPLDPDRLVKLLGMLGSDHDGERAAFGLKADQLLRSHGLTWADVIRIPTAIADNDDDPEAPWRRMRAECLRRAALLTPKERVFLINIDDWNGPLTERQQSWLQSIHRRLRREAA